MVLFAGMLWFISRRVVEFNPGYNSNTTEWKDEINFDQIEKDLRTRDDQNSRCDSDSTHTQSFTFELAYGNMRNDPFKKMILGSLYRSKSTLHPFHDPMNLSEMADEEPIMKRILSNETDDGSEGRATSHMFDSGRRTFDSDN